MSGSTPEALSEARSRAVALDAAIGETDWTELPTGAVRSSFAAPSGALAVISMGDPRAPRVVLVPGVTGSKEDFLLMLPLLAEAGYFVQSLDLAGQYESHAAGPAEGQPFTFELLVNDMIDLLEDGGPAHLLGYSFAGMVAQLVAVLRPDLVRSLALLTTPPATGNVFLKTKGLKIIAPFVSPRRGASLMIWGIRRGLNNPPVGRLKFVHSRFDLTNRRSVDDMVGLMMRFPDLRAELRELSLPICVAASTHDMWPVKEYKRYAEQIGAAFRLYRTGHSPCETTPHELVLDLIEFYRRA